MAGHLVRRDRPGGAGQLQSPYGFRAPSPRDDVEVRIEWAGGEDDVPGPLVRVDRGNQPSGALDSRLLEQVFARRIALEVEASLGAQAPDGLFRLIDHGVGDFVILELGHDLGTDAAVAAEDEVVVELVQAALQLTVPPV